MPSITWTIDDDGNVSMEIEGIKGTACKPIHEFVSRDLAQHLGITEASAEDTAEMNEQPLRNPPARNAQRQ